MRETLKKEWISECNFDNLWINQLKKGVYFVNETINKGDIICE